VIRGSDGEWLGVILEKYWYGHAYVVELWGVFEGLVYAKRLGLRAAELHIDSLIVANVLTSNKNGGPCGRSLVEKIRRLLELEWEVVVHNSSYRDVNQYADVLANFGRSLSLV